MNSFIFALPLILAAPLLPMTGALAQTPAPISGDRSTAESKIEESLVTTLSEKDYADLRAYMNRAREILEDTLKSAQQLGGVELHRRLEIGIRASLEQTRLNSGLIDIKNDKLLFVAVLNRALFIDDLFLKEERNEDTLTSAGSVVLLHSIRLALNYYKTSDSPRFETKLVPSPDWVSFAREEIPVLVRMSSLATTAQARRQIVLNILGWTQADLNRSVARRELASIIINLGTIKNDIERDIRPTIEGQQMLENLVNVLGEKTKDQNSDAPTDQNQTSSSDSIFPKGNYPSTSSDGPGYSFFPLLDISGLRDVDTHVRSIIRDTYDKSSWDSFQSDFFGQLGVGGGIDAISGQKAGSFAAVSARARQIFFWDLDISGSYARRNCADPFSSDCALFQGASIALNGQSDVGVGSSNAPVYNFKFSGAVNAYFVLGTWFAVEQAKYNQFKETIVRGGWSAHLPIVIGNTSYMLIRFGVGGSGRGYGPQQADFRGDLALTAQLLMRISKFVLNIEWNGDFDTVRAREDSYGREYDVPRTRGKRHNLAASLAIPLGAIFPNDGLRIEGEWTHFGKDDRDSPVVNFYKAGGYYEVRF